MITFKLHTDTTQLNDVNREFMRVVRMTYVMWRNYPNKSLSEAEAHIKSYDWMHLDASLIKMAVNQAKNLRERPKVIFGSQLLFNKLKWHQGDPIKTLEAYQASRNTGMLLRGSSSDPRGNRKAKLDICNNRIVVKACKGQEVHLPIQMPCKRRKQLLQLQLACEQNKAYFNLQVCDGYVCVSFDESVLSQSPAQAPIKGRILSMDSNPNYWGVVIADASGIIHKEIIDFADLNHKAIKNNKKRHEKHQAVKHMMDLARHYRCEAIAVEKLHMPGVDHKKGRTFNRLVNNTWHKNLIHNSIQKWCVIHNIKFMPVVAAYSSFVGCVENPQEFDSVAAAIELNKRARLAINRQKYDLLPKHFDPESIPTPWKEMGLAALLANGLTSWRQLYDWCRDTKFSYRVLYKRGDPSVVPRRLSSARSLVHVAHMHANGVVDLCIPA